MLSRLDIKFFKMAVGVSNIGKETSVDITARCPVCGDSQKSKNKKRLHLYTKGTVTNVNCFNGDCQVHNKTMHSFLRDFYPALLSQYKRENFGNTLERLARGEEGDVLADFKKEEPKKAKEVVTQDFSMFFEDMNQSPEGMAYIGSRGFIYNENHHGKWYFSKQDLKIGETLYKLSNSVVIPLYYEGEMYGFYSRNISEKIFYTYMNDHNIGYKIWNWFKVDKNQPVFIFEGIFDALASGLPNIIALMGAKLPEERLQELKHPVFVLDNDRTGMMNSLEYAKRGHQVYIQPEKYSSHEEKDMNGFMQCHPEIVTSDLIQNNLFSGIMAEIRIMEKL